MQSSAKTLREDLEELQPTVMVGSPRIFSSFEFQVIQQASPADPAACFLVALVACQ